jgi:hypothetical protein
VGQKQAELTSLVEVHSHRATEDDWHLRHYGQSRPKHGMRQFRNVLAANGDGSRAYVDEVEQG